MIPDLKTILDERHLTLAVAESASVGRLASLVASVSGASTYFRGGIIAYTLDMKVKHLGVNQKLAAEVNCVSGGVACEMAAGVRRMFGTDIGLAITGYADPGPNGGRFCWVGFAVGEQVWAEPVEYEPNSTVLAPPEMRVDAQLYFAWMAAEGLLHFLRSQS